MRDLQFTLALLLLVSMSSSNAVWADLPPTLNVAKQQLKLNGKGVRQKYFLDLYEAGLYLGEAHSTAPEIVAADGWMAIRIVITSKMVSQEKLVASLQEGFKNSTGGKLQSIQPQVDQFRQCFADTIARGDTFDVVYAPGHGTVVLKNGKQKGTVKGLPFKQALFGIWLGKKPADAGLKLALLGSTRGR